MGFSQFNDGARHVFWWKKSDFHPVRSMAPTSEISCIIWHKMTPIISCNIWKYDICRCILRKLYIYIYFLYTYACMLCTVIFEKFLTFLWNLSLPFWTPPHHHRLHTSHVFWRLSTLTMPLFLPRTHPLQYRWASEPRRKQVNFALASYGGKIPHL